MHFLNTRLYQETSLKFLANPRKQGANLAEFEQTETLPPASDDQPETPNLMGKLYRFQSLGYAGPPEMPYENEAWAPKQEGISIFRKHRLHGE